MSSPNYDQLHVDHSKRIGDPVAAAATNGSVYSSVLRDIHLNEACRRLMVKYLNKYLAEEKAGQLASWDFFRSLANQEAKTLTANVYALDSWTGGVFHIIGVKNATKGISVFKMPEGMNYLGDTSDNDYFVADAKDQYWTTDGGNFRLIDGSATTADSINLRYIKAWTAMTATFASDIPIPSSYFSLILDLAYAIAKSEKATAEAQQLAQAKMADVTKEIG